VAIALESHNNNKSGLAKKLICCKYRCRYSKVTLIYKKVKNHSKNEATNTGQPRHNNELETLEA